MALSSRQARALQASRASRTLGGRVRTCRLQRKHAKHVALAVPIPDLALPAPDPSAVTTGAYVALGAAGKQLGWLVHTAVGNQKTLHDAAYAHMAAYSQSVHCLCLHGATCCPASGRQVTRRETTWPCCCIASRRLLHRHFWHHPGLFQAVVQGGC